MFERPVATPGDLHRVLTEHAADLLDPVAPIPHQIDELDYLDCLRGSVESATSALSRFGVGFWWLLPEPGVHLSMHQALHGWPVCGGVPG